MAMLSLPISLALTISEYTETPYPTETYAVCLIGKGQMLIIDMAHITIFQTDL